MLAEPGTAVLVKDTFDPSSCGPNPEYMQLAPPFGEVLPRQDIGSNWHRRRRKPQRKGRHVA